MPTYDDGESTWDDALVLWDADDAPDRFTEWVEAENDHGQRFVFGVRVRIVDQVGLLDAVNYGGRRPVELQGVTLARLLTSAVAIARARQERGTDEVTNEDMAGARLERRTNRRMTDDFLREVARLYKDADDHKAAKVAELLNLGRRSAERYIKAAREKGYIG